MTNPVRAKLALGAAALFALLLAGCAGDGKPTQSTVSAPTPAPVPSIPHDAKFHHVELSSAAWKSSDVIKRDSTGAKTTFYYVGTGELVDNIAATVPISVVPGKIYVFSAFVDSSKIKSGEFDLFIDAADGRSTYTAVYSKAAAPARYATPAWLCPPGITRVLLGMQIVHTSVEKGSKLKFSKPVFSDLVSQPRSTARREVKRTSV